MTEDGVVLEAVYRSGTEEAEIGVLLVHGFLANADSPPTAALAGLLADRGYATLALSLRDHGCCEFRATFEDGSVDIDAGVRFLREQGASAVVVAGHSLGANRAAYYGAQSEDLALQGLILMAPPGSLYEVALGLGGPLTRQILGEATRRLGESDRVDELMPILLPLGQGFATPASIVSHAGPDTNSDHGRWVPVIGVPMLFVHGTADSIVPPVQSLRAHELAAGAPRADLALLEGAGHLFAGYEEDLADLIAQWLAEL